MPPSRCQPSDSTCRSRRAYELLLELFSRRVARRAGFSELTRSVLSFAGLAAILGSIVLIHRDTPFPGWVALAPAGGAALMILAGLQGPAPLFNRLLQAPPLILFGKISYSLYLWHWPVLVLYKYRIGRDPTLIETAVLFVVAVALAYLSWRFVEAPFRDRSRFSRRSIFAMAAIATAIVFGCGAALVVAHGLPQRIPPGARRYLVADPLSRLAPCFSPSLAAIQQGRLCAIGAGHSPDAATFVVWGDSHAYRLATGLDTLAAAKHKTGVLLTVGGCPPLPGVGSPTMRLHGCDQVR